MKKKADPNHPTTGLFVFAEPKSPWRRKCFGFHFHGCTPDKAWEGLQVVRSGFGDDYNIRSQWDSEHFAAMSYSFWRRRRIVWTCAEYVGEAE